MKILIATGGTGGHIFPAIETAKVLKSRGHQVDFAGVLGAAEEKVKNLGFPVFPLSARGLSGRSPLQVLQFCGTMSKAVMDAFGVIRQCLPDKIIGFGGYGSFPVVMAGALMRRPVMVHEQNVVPGKANALLAKMAKKVAISFESSRRYFDAGKVVWTGCPCRSGRPTSKAEGLRAFGLEDNKKTLLVLGGSQGSQRINEVFGGLIKALAGEGWQAVHMTGRKEYAFYEAQNRREGLPVRTYAFIDDIAAAYAAADMVIARAGAATVTELGILGIPAVLVPYPFAGNHQKHNAEVLSGQGAAVVVQQKNVSPASLKESIERLSSTPCSRQEILKRTKGLFQADAALQLALAAESL